MLGLNSAATYLGVTSAGIIGAAGIQTIGAHSLGIVGAVLALLALAACRVRHLAHHLFSALDRVSAPDSVVSGPRFADDVLAIQGEGAIYR